MASSSSSSSSDAAAAPCHGFEDAQSDCTCCNCNGCSSIVLSSVLSSLMSHQLKDRMLLFRIWKLALGSTAPSFQRVYVIGDRQTLHDLAPNRGKGYPSFITPLEYKKSDPNDDEDMEADAVEPMLSVTDKVFVILLPGEYESSKLWDHSFTGTNAVLGIVRSGHLAQIYSTSDGMFECRGKTFVGNCVLQPTARCDEDVLISVSGSLRIMKCIFDPGEDVVQSFAPYKESGHFIQVQHNGGLAMEGTLMGRSTRSCILCEGRCVVSLDNVTFREAGIGEKYRRICKADGTFPYPLQGRDPAIAVSYASTITATECEFDSNYGYPVQYASKAEETGAIALSILDDDPEEYARRAVQGQERFSKKERQRVYREELEQRRKAIEEVKEKRIKGSVKMMNCSFKNNGLSPYIPEIPDSSPKQAKVEPWFAENSRMMELVDIDYALEPREAYYTHEEARSDRTAWEEDYYEDTSLLAAEVLDSLSDDHSVFDILVDAMRAVDVWSCPREAFGQNGTTVSASELETAFGMMDEGEIVELRETMLNKLEESLQTMSATVKEMAECPRAEELCWGVLTDSDAPYRLVLVAESTIVALHGIESGRTAISPYRAKVLVERMQCSKDETGESYNDDGCGCDDHVTPTHYAAFLLGLSHDSIAEALFDLLMDEASSSHGKQNAAEILQRLAFMKPNLRQHVVDALTLVISDDCAISNFCRARLPYFLGQLNAKESKDVIESACLNGKMYKIGETCGGFVDFLMLVGLPVDIAHPAVDKEVSIPPLDAMRVKRTSEREFRKLVDKSIARKTREIEKHNATIRGSPPCDECGKCPPKGQAFPLCTRCLKATYCGKDCQRAAWRKDHKAVCKPPRKVKGKK